MIPQRRADHGLTIHLPPEGLGMRLCRCRASFLRLLMFSRLLMDMQWVSAARARAVF